ncbi:MAG: acylphosphatase [Methylobacterium sp.]|uniref:acylphosphatase n=1 Tax=Methylobacterium sp. TaxID=409 RepID=UPI0025CC7A5C|nr:acylphosphatase [Methylobacterium sp.]MBX9933143.1 acylphosphatase [Methylobacterium sp.]
MTSGIERTVSVVVVGRVQGVGFRAWVKTRAQKLRLSGHVRNRADGAVEAVLSGTSDAVAEMIDACRQGPPVARVDEVTVSNRSEETPPGFLILRD